MKTKSIFTVHIAAVLLLTSTSSQETANDGTCPVSNCDVYSDPTCETPTTSSSSEPIADTVNWYMDRYLGKCEESPTADTSYQGRCENYVFEYVTYSDPFCSEGAKVSQDPLLKLDPIKTSECFRFKDLDDVN